MKEKFKNFWIKISQENINWRKVKIWPILTYIIYTLVIIFAVSILLSKFSIAGIKLLTVQSGSMAPTIKTGSLVFIKSQDNYYSGDIVTFQNSTDPSQTTTHRIVNVTQENGFSQFQTQGDANNTPDGLIISKEQIIGKAKLAIPYLGYLVAFVKTLPGLIILILIPAVIIIYEEIINIKNHIKSKRQKKLEGQEVK